MGIERIDGANCTGCGVCVEVCPMDVIRMNIATSKAYVQYLRDCQSCFLCEVECPEDAVRVVARFETRMITAW